MGTVHAGKKAVVIFNSMESWRRPLARLRYVAMYCSVRPTKRRLFRKVVFSCLPDIFANSGSESKHRILYSDPICLRWNIRTPFVLSVISMEVDSLMKSYMTETRGSI